MAKTVTQTLLFEPDEHVIKRAEKVGYGSPVSTHHHELYLTDRALIHVKKSMLGKVKEVVRFPLGDIRRSGDTVEVKLGKPDHVTSALDVYLDYGVESFRLTWDNEVEDWIADITETITGRKVERKSDFDGFQDLIKMADTMAGTMDHVRSAFGIKSTEQGTCKCAGCGASVSGIVGEAVKCPY